MANVSVYQFTNVQGQRAFIGRYDNFKVEDIIKEWLKRDGWYEPVFTPHMVYASKFQQSRHCPIYQIEP